MKRILISIGLIISCLSGYSQVFVSDGGGSSNIDEAAVGSQISDSLANLAITVNVLSTADTVFAIHNDSLVAIPVTAITTPLQDDIDSINNVVQNIYTLLSGLGYDLVAPSIDSIVLGGQGPSDYIFRLYFNEQLNQDSVPSHLDFTVTENGNAFNLSSSGVSNNMVTVSGATPTYGNTYLLSYAKGDTAIQDTARNKADNWTGHTVVNRLPAPEEYNMLTNGELTGGTSWDVDGSFVITDGVAIFTTGTSSGLKQTAANMAVVVATNTEYTLTFTLAVDGGFENQTNIRIDNYDSNVNYSAQASYMSGEISITFTTPADIGVGGIKIRASSTSPYGCTIDNIVLQ